MGVGVGLCVRATDEPSDGGQAMVVKRWWLWWLMVVVVRAAISKHRRVISTHGKQSMGFLDKKMINDMDYPQGITDNALR